MRILETMYLVSQILTLPAIIFAGFYAKKFYETAKQNLEVAKDDIESTRELLMFDRDIKLYDAFEKRLNDLRDLLSKRGKEGQNSLLWNEESQKPVLTLDEKYDTEDNWFAVCFLLHRYIMIYIADIKDERVFLLVREALYTFPAVSHLLLEWLDKSPGFRDYAESNLALDDFFTYYLDYEF